MRTASLLISLAAFAGMAAAKRGCRHDPAHPGQGWYYIVSGDDLNSIAADFGTTAAALAKTNNIANPDFISAGTTIVVPCA
ncbi:peptidase m23b [Colletotrichum graminicola]|nr:peptidase m23b [Colletotrichum graminicola]